MPNTYLYRTSTSATLATKYTISFWIKIANIGVDYRIVNQYADANNTAAIYFDASNNYLNIVDKLSGSTHLDISTTRKFRDTNAWYHIVIAADTTQATAADRLKVYINGVQETSFSPNTYPSQNASLGMQTVSASGQRRIGSHNGGGDYLDGSLAHFHFIDGLAYPASTFGETDSTSGIWVPKTSPSVTYGNNGVFLKFGNSGAMGTDSSGNTNTMTPSGTLTQNIDTPSNNFATLNPVSTISNLTYANANLQITGVGSSVWKSTFSSIGMMYGKAGKFYCEMKVSSLNSQAGIGVWGQPISVLTTSNFFPNHHQYGFVYKEDGSVSDDGQTFYTGSSFTSGDIIQCALDLTNSKIYFGKNGTWQNSGDPTSGSTGTGAVALENNGDAYFFTASSYGTDVLQMNFGQGYFGTTAVASAGSNASGIGTFEYDVPAGYTALSTKGLDI